MAIPTNLYTVARFGMAVPREQIDASDEGAGQTGELDASKDPPEEDDSGRDPQLENLLDEGLRALNLLIRAYRTVKDDLSVFPVGGIGSLPFALLYTLWDVSRSRDLSLGAACQRRDDLDLLGMGLFMVNMNLRVDPEPLSFEDTARVVGMASNALKGNPHPLFASADLFRSAGSKLDVGDNNAAVIESVTARDFRQHPLEVAPRTPGDKQAAGRQRVAGRLQEQAQRPLGAEDDGVRIQPSRCQQPCRGVVHGSLRDPQRRGPPGTLCRHRTGAQSVLAVSGGLRLPEREDQRSPRQVLALP